MIQTLIEKLGVDAVLHEKNDIFPYGFDGTATLKVLPKCVVFPKTTEQVAEVVKIAKAHNAPIVSRGSGTGLSGGSVPAENSIVLCLLKMDKMLEVDDKNLTLHCEAGAITSHIEKEAQKVGLFYPPDPGSMKVSTIGGNVANNSGGLRGLKYGVTRNYVMGLRVVLPDGEITWLGNKCVKDVAGYNLKDLFIGSEGTLGIITEVLLRLIPTPEDKVTLLAIYDDMSEAAATVSDIIASQIVPCTLEFLDRNTIRCVEEYAKVGLPDAAAILLMETDGKKSVVQEEAQQMKTLAEKHNAREIKVAQNTEQAIELATARRSAFSALARIRPTTILEDITVPRSELVTIVQYINEVALKHKLTIGVFGHFGDGNIHPTFLTNEKDAEEMERVEEAMEEIVKKTVELGGTITGEHGVGLAKKPFMHTQFDRTSMTLLRAIKKTIDPDNRLNPGKIFDLED